MYKQDESAGYQTRTLKGCLRLIINPTTENYHSSQLCRKKVCSYWPTNYIKLLKDQFRKTSARGGAQTHSILATGQIS